MKLSILLFCFAAFMAACSPDGSGTPKIAGSEQQALDKAKAVDAAVQESVTEERRAIDEQAE